MTASPLRIQQTEATPARALGAGALRTLCLDLLGRPPFQRERDQWQGRARHDWLDAHLGKIEFWQHWLEEQLYYFFLIDNFRPETERIAELPLKLGEGRLDVREAVHRVALSSSFELRNPGADTFVTVVMEQLTGLRVEKYRRDLEIGKALYDGREGLFLGRLGSSQADVVRIAIEDKRFSQSFVEREYEHLVKTAPERREAAAWSRTLHKDPRRFLELVREWALSAAYDQRLASPVEQPNRLFVRALYVDLLDRLPTAEEAEPLREALDGLADSAPLRSILVRLFLDSGRVELPEREELHEPTLWVGAQFERLLGRSPSEVELEAFVRALSSPEGRPALLLYALLSSPEYARY
jgi:hypothetical protein